jgi:homoserine kinase type II
MTEAELASVLRYYPLGKLRAAQRPERGFVNDNWIVDTTRGRYFLKHRHPDLAVPTFIRAEHALTTRLRIDGFPAPALVPTARGKTLLSLDGECYEIQEYIEGSHCNHQQSAHLKAAAETLGRYHILVRGFAPAALCHPHDLYSPTLLSTNLSSLAQAWQMNRDSGLAPLATQLTSHATSLATRFTKHGKLPRLIIHGDYYADNLLFRGNRIVGVVDYDKACWQPRVVEIAEALIYFASPQPAGLKHLVYPGVLNWEPFGRFLQAYAHTATLSQHEVEALPDYVSCIWLQISLQRLLEKGHRSAAAQEALHEVLTLGNWASANAPKMIEMCHSAIREPS